MQQFGRSMFHTAVFTFESIWIARPLLQRSSVS